MSGGYATASKIRVRPKSIGRGRPIQTSEPRKMKLTLKQRIRNWLMSDDDEADYSPMSVETDRFQSNGMRFQLYKAAGGYVIETRNYDQRKDEDHNKMYVITEDKDLGAELGKIITMESLR